MNGIKVLYVEDEVFLGKIVKETLESRGFEVVMETNGSRVLTAFENGQDAAKAFGSNRFSSVRF